MPFDQLPTPCLMIDEPIVKRNLDRLAQYTAEHNIGLRPHTKTHKSRRIAQMQLDAGAIGLTAAKTGEAEVMADLCDDLLVAYPVVSPPRCQTLAHLARDRTLRVDADSLTGIQALSTAASKAGSTLGVLVEIDFGMRRTGVQTPAESLQLAQAIDKAPGLRLDGIMIYPGHVKKTPKAQQPVLEKIDAELGEIIALWKQSGLEAKIISGGSTPTAYQSHHIKNLTEIRPGTYVFNDLNTVIEGYATIDDCAARVLATVVSTAVPGQAVIDAGSKMLSGDRHHDANGNVFGCLADQPQARITRLSEEHGIIDTTHCTTPPAVGDRIQIIPYHVCPCVNLQDKLWWINSDSEPVELLVDARGRVA